MGKVIGEKSTTNQGSKDKKNLSEKSENETVANDDKVTPAKDNNEEEKKNKVEEVQSVDVRKEDIQVVVGTSLGLGVDSRQNDLLNNFEVGRNTEKESSLGDKSPELSGSLEKEEKDSEETTTQNLKSEDSIREPELRFVGKESTKQALDTIGTLDNIFGDDHNKKCLLDDCSDVGTKNLSVTNKTESQLSTLTIEEDDEDIYNEEEEESQNQINDFKKEVPKNNQPSRRGDPVEKDHFYTELKIDTKNFYSNFLKTGQCINTLFKDIEKDKFFNKPIKEEKEPISMEKSKFDFLNTNNKINNACYLYNVNDETNAERLEISIRGENSGWIFMMSSNKNHSESDQKIFYREFVVEKVGKTWSVTRGQEGEIELLKDKGYGIDYNINDGIEKKIRSLWFDVHYNSPCVENTPHFCRYGKTKQKSLAFYWKPNINSEKNLFQLLKAGAKNKISMKSDHENKIDHKRKRIYLKQTWWKNYEIKYYHPLIELEETNLNNTKGDWVILNRLCQTYYKSDFKPDDYETYCLIYPN